MADGKWLNSPVSLVDNIIHLFAPLTANCSTFTERWAQGGGRNPAGMSGRWSGEWVSAATGHRGPLRCVSEAVSPDRWHMFFRAEYSRIFRACYATDFAVSKAADRWTFTGASNLGVLAGGAYSYTGHATTGELICDYRSARDHGEFRLRRLTT